MSEQWLNNYEQLDRFMNETSSLIQKKKNLQKENQNASTVSSQIRKNLNKIKKNYDKLESLLEKCKNNPDRYHLTQKEVARRSDLLANARIKKEKINSDFHNKGSNFRREVNVKWGEEDDETLGKTNKEILGLQEEMINDQDDKLDLLSTSIGRQKQIATTVGDELDLQSRLLDDVDEKMDRTGNKIKREDRRMNKLLVSSRSRWLLGIVCLLLIILIVLACTHWGKDIWG
ncbi:hypothetical protein M0813_20478 [Anaeramoeba flamelloides]|uniref:t-SNARE coiled-coil homology domain-containing protein n=1 Tax=Anaeramoeba flamelloides TaxID=1746091 RepID=A0ABQ8YL61_9EUKA|nr:hypothetical protein M0813_20478 [Anaeramoeba flamelloides]